MEAYILAAAVGLVLFIVILVAMPKSLSRDSSDERRRQLLKELGGEEGGDVEESVSFERRLRAPVNGSVVAR